MSFWRSSPTRPGLALAAAVAAGGIVLSLLTGAAVHRAARDAGDQLMDRRAELVQDAVAHEADRYAGTVRQLAASVGSYVEFTPQKFLRLTESLPAMHLAGATSIAFVAPPVSDAGVPALQSRWRALGAEGLVLSPAGHGDHPFVVSSRSLDGQPTRRPGVDLTRAPAAHRALLAARDTGEVQVSAAYQLLIDRSLPARQRQMSFVLAAPAWEPGPGPVRALRGWVLMALRGQDFCGEVMRRAAQNLADVTLVARDADDRQITAATMTMPATGPRDIRRRVEVPVAQDRWTVEVAGKRARLPGASGTTGTLIIWGGITISVLLALLVLTLATGRSRARVKVVEATAQSRAAEAEARRQAGLLSAVLESISEAVGVVDENGAFIVHNRAAKDLLGVADTDDRGEPVIEPNREGTDNWQEHYGIYRPDGLSPFPTEELPLVRALHGESTNDVEMLIRNAGRPEGVLIAVSGRPLDEAAGQAGAVAVFRDVTAERAQQAELAAFAAVAAHDLRTPLAVIAGYAELVADTVMPELRRPDTVELAASVEHQLGTITARARGGALLVDDLLRFASSRDARLDLEEVDLHALAEEVVGQYHEKVTTLGGPHAAPARFTVDPLPVVRGDRGLLRQVLDNLVGNAVKYTVEGSPCEVTVTSTSRPADVAPGAEPGPVHLEVRDRGMGIPAGQHEAIFGAFRRAEGQTGAAGVLGTGLGLAICRRIVERHGGTMAARDNPGGGTVIAFTLAVPTPTAPATAGARP